MHHRKGTVPSVYARREGLRCLGTSTCLCDLQKRTLIGEVGEQSWQQVLEEIYPQFTSLECLLGLLYGSIRLS